MRRWGSGLPIAIAGQSRDRPELEDVALRDALAEIGMRSVLAPWDDPGVTWTGYSGVIVRSCWNYHHHPDKFLGWLDQLERLAVPVVNHSPLIRWNLDKAYLLDLQRQVPTVPTVRVGRDDPRTLATIMEAAGWMEAVVKPAVSASADRTSRIRLCDCSGEEALRAAAKRGAALVQPYMAAVEHGETSLIYLGGHFSHAVLKRPARGEFRVQPEFGGTIESVPATPFQLALAEKALRLAPADPVIARVDLIDGPSGPLLMELELIEPRLFTAHAPEAASRAARAIAEALGPGERLQRTSVG